MSSMCGVVPAMAIRVPIRPAPSVPLRHPPGEGLSGSEGRSEGEISMERVYGRAPTAATIDWSRYGPHRAPNVSNISIPGQHAWRESLGLGPGRCSVPYGSAALSRRHRRSSSISRQPSRLPQRVGRARRRVNGGTGTPTTGTALSRATCRSVAPVTFGFRAAPRALSSRTGQRRRGRSLCDGHERPWVRMPNAQLSARFEGGLRGSCLISSGMRSYVDT